jgi:uncharacterized repeat protein (TIGR01451 family)
VRSGKQSIEWFRKELDMERNKFSKHKRRAGIGRRLLSGVALLGLSGVIALACTMSGDESSESSVVQKVHDVGLFELDVVCDGDSTNAGDLCTLDAECDGGLCAVGAANTFNQGNDDWANVFNDTSSAFATAFINDSFGGGTTVIPGFESRTPEASFFTGGGSKDVSCLQDPCDSPSGGAGGPWLYDTKNSVAPDKNDIVTAFAAAYDDPNDQHVIFYFGLDTYAVQGNSNAGFWFFRRPVGLNPLAPGETQGTFSGDHTEGDIFVAVAYTGGGKIGDILVYRWDSSIQQGQSPVGLVQIASGADCADVAANDDVCGVVNSTAGEDPPWDYYNKENEETYKVPAFVEFGLDITELLGPDIGCFSTFLAETRSSQSETAQLKDFALGAFPVCGIEVNKTDGDLSKVGDEVTYTIDIENTGRATLYAKDITDSVLGDIVLNGVDQANPNVDSNTCGASLLPGATCTITLSYAVDAGDVVNDTNDGGNTILPNEVTIVYTEYDDFTGLAFNEDDGHVIDLFEPAITFTKTGTPTTMLQGTQVNYEITLTNASSDDTPPLDCTITDTALGINQDVVLMGTPVTLTPSKVWDLDDAACTKLADDTFDCTNTAQVTCQPRGFADLNDLDEEASVTVNVIPADIALTITKDCSEYSKVNTWEGWTADDAIDYEIVITNETSIPLNLVAINDSVLGNLLADCTSPLAPNGEAGDTCTINKEHVVTQDANELTNSVTVTFNDGVGGENITTDPPVTCTTDLLHPNLTVEKSCASQEPVPSGASANFEIKITNGTVPPSTVPGGDVNGDVDLDTNVVDNDFDVPINLDVLLGTAPAGGCLEGDYGDGATPELDAADGCLLLEGGITATGTQVSNTVNVTATLPELYGLSNVLNRENSDTCDVQQGDATRTWGFWKTHGSDGDLFLPPDYPESWNVDFGYTCHVFEDHLGGMMNLGWKQVDSCEDLFAIFWAHRARESDGTPRNKVSRECQAQVRCSGQVAAALLNTGLDNGAPLDPHDLAAVLDALANGNRKQINQACAPIAAYNESGDDVMIIDEDGAMIPHADPNGTRAEADYPFADCN